MISECNNCEEAKYGTCEIDICCASCRVDGCETMKKLSLLDMEDADIYCLKWRCCNYLPIQKPASKNGDEE